MTYDQFEKSVSDAIAKHISRDRSIELEDQEWESRNAARTLALALRVEGVLVPHPVEKLP